MAGGTIKMGAAEALRRLAASRDGEAWEALVELHGAEILRASRRVLGDAALAEDACQETFLLLRDRAGQFQGASDPERADFIARAWVLRVACTTALQMLRRRKGDRKREDEHVRERGAAVAPQTEARIMDEEQAALVRRELERLPEDDRLPVVLHYYGGMQFGEVAAALDCPEGTAKSRVRRALEELRRRLAVLGLFLIPSQISDFLGEGAARAAEVSPSPELAARWKSLLTSDLRPTVPWQDWPSQKGLSTMAKIGIGVAALALIGVAAVTAPRLGGAEQRQEPSRKENGPDVNGKKIAAAADPAKPPAKRPPEAAPARAPVNLAPATDAEKKAAIEGSNAAALDLYAKLKDEKGNLFFSPYSVSTALAMTYAGARGQTEAQMAKTLGFSLAQERLHAAFGAIIRGLNADKGPDGKKRGFQLAVANRLFGQKGFEFLPDFLAVGKALYGAPLQEVDFKGATEEARLTINRWVEDVTKEKIKDLIAKGQLAPEGRLVLTNAIYFKGDWAKQFKKEETKNEVFHLAAGAQADVPMMHDTRELAYVEAPGRMQAVSIPYVGDELSMVVFLPAEKSSVEELEKDLTGPNLKDWLEKMEELRVTLSLPRFKMTWGTKDLVPHFKAMGMTDAIDPRKADFTGMTTKEPLFISLILHKAFVDVNEEGTEAAAATAVVMRVGGARSVPPPPKIFRADRPFLFLIRENASGAILFMGRVADPREAK